MKIITLWQPWATWIEWDWKSIETRTHNKFISLKGQTIGIHAGNNYDKNAFDAAKLFLDPEQIIEHNNTSYPLGCIICTAFVSGVGKLSTYNQSRALIECVTVRYGLFLTQITPIKPIFIKGHQGIWNYNL